MTEWFFKYNDWFTQNMPCALRRVADRCEDFGTRLLHFIMKSTYSNVYLFTKVLIYIEAYLGRCFGSNSSKRCLQQMCWFFPHTEEGAFVSDGRLAERRRVKGILNKGADSNIFSSTPFSYRLDTVHSALLRKQRCRQHYLGFKIPCFARPC